MQTQHHGSTQLWALKLSKWFTQQGFDIWILRNQQVHDKDDTTPLHQRLNHQIDQLYKLQDDLPATDRTLFDTPIEERYNLPEKFKKTWISETTKTVQTSLKEHQQKMSSGQKDIRTYFSKNATS